MTLLMIETKYVRLVLFIAASSKDRSLTYVKYLYIHVFNVYRNPSSKGFCELLVWHFYRI